MGGFICLERKTKKEPTVKSPGWKVKKNGCTPHKIHTNRCIPGITYRRIFAAQWWTFTFTKCKCGCGGYIDIRGPHRLGHFCIFTPMWCSWCGALFRHSFFAVSFFSPFFLISWSKHRPGFLFVRHFVRWKIERVRRGARQITFKKNKRVFKLKTNKTNE